MEKAFKIPKGHDFYTRMDNRKVKEIEIIIKHDGEIYKTTKGTGYLVSVEHTEISHSGFDFSSDTHQAYRLMSASIYQALSHISEAENTNAEDVLRFLEAACNVALSNLEKRKRLKNEKLN